MSVSEESIIIDLETLPFDNLNIEKINDHLIHKQIKAALKAGRFNDARHMATNILAYEQLKYYRLKNADKQKEIRELAAKMAEEKIAEANKQVQIAEEINQGLQVTIDELRSALDAAEQEVMQLEPDMHERKYLDQIFRNHFFERDHNRIDGKCGVVILNGDRCELLNSGPNNVCQFHNRNIRRHKLQNGQ